MVFFLCRFGALTGFFTLVLFFIEEFSALG
jgi:hypothetical protein